MALLYPEVGRLFPDSNPLVAPGLPEPHPDFVAAAKLANTSVVELTRQCLYNDETTITLPNNKAGAKSSVRIMAGHIWSLGAERKQRGPAPAEIMVVGKCFSLADKDLAYVLAGVSGEIFVAALKNAGFDVKDFKNWYVTNLLKSLPLMPNKSAIPRLWFAQQAHLLYQELAIVKPKLIIAQGTESIKAFMGSSAKLNSTERKLNKFKLDLTVSPDSPNQTLDIAVVAMASPLSVSFSRSRLGLSKSGTDMTNEEKRFQNQCNYISAIVKQNFKVVKSEEEVITEDENKVGAVHLLDGLKYYVVETTRQLRHHLELMRSGAREKVVAWDAEWQGNHPGNKGSYLRCIQFAYRPDQAVVLALTYPGGKPRFRHYDSKTKQWNYNLAPKIAAKLCKYYMSGMRAAGHFFNADLEWLVPFGLDLRKEYDAAPSSAEARHKGGLATELAAHAIDETAMFGLTEQLASWTDTPNYDSDFEKSKKAERAAKLKALCSVKRDLAKYKKCTETLKAGRKLSLNLSEFFNNTDIHPSHVTKAEEKLKATKEGYGWISDEALYPYAAWDAAGELKLAYALFLDGGLDADRYGNSCWHPYWISHRAALPVLEINRTGLLVDRKTVDELSMIFTEAKDKVLEEVRAYLNWPGFQPTNRFQVAEALFGQKYNGYYQQYGEKKRFRPEGAKTLNILPLRTTGKRPKDWVELTPDQELSYIPAADRNTLNELFHQGDSVVCRAVSGGEVIKVTRDHSEILRKLLDLKFLIKATQSLIRSPVKDDNDELVKDSSGNLTYSAGVIDLMCDDGYCRTSITQTAETGRWKSRNPNLQNCSKSRDSDYKRILGKSYKPLRSAFTSPPGWFLVECDYSGAELMVTAILSQDQTMIKHCQSSSLDENDPDYNDIHSTVAVEAFKLNCEPKPSAITAIGKKHLRVGAKRVVFGTLYGQSPQACAALLRQDGVDVTVDDTMALQHAFFSAYPNVPKLLNKCASRVKYGFLYNMFGRIRRFTHANNDAERSAMEREAKNAPIQGTVADAVSIAIRNLYDYRNKHNMDFKICLQIHDALLLYVPHYELEKVVDKTDGVLMTCMVKQVPLKSVDLDGKLMSNETYYFNCGIDIETHWGAIPMPSEFTPYGLSPALAGWHPCDGGYKHNELGDNVYN